jgi:hypothetical protein
MALYAKNMCPRDLYDVQNLGKANIEENCMTMSRFILLMRRKDGRERVHLSQLMNTIQTIVKSISNAVKRVSLDTVSVLWSTIKLFTTMGKILNNFKMSKQISTYDD